MEDLQRKRLRVINIRLLVLIVLAAVPVVLYLAAGTYAVWEMGLLGWLWWILPACWLVTWVVAKLWRKPKSQDLEKPDARHWTPRDQEAAEIVLRYQQQVDNHSPKQLTDLHFYLSQLQSLATDLATHYHPDSNDPFSSLTIPELAAAIRLVADDLEQLALHSLPGSRLLTVQQWKALRDTPKWLTRIRNSVWAGSILINPMNIARYGASRATIDKVSTGIQSEILAAIYLRCIRQAGFYLIEMNSGRLRGGADEYRAAFERREENAAKKNSSGGAKTGSEPDAVQIESESLTIGLIGQVSAGKSSLINALSGCNDAAIDILPQTREVQRYRLPVPDKDSEVALLDSPGYAESGADKKQLREIETALAESDVVLLVLDAHNPARATDVATLEKLHERYLKNRNLKPPPVIAVLTHIDLLSPVMEWSPPYDFSSPKQAKEGTIADAIQYTRELLGDWIVDVVAVCSAEDPDRRFGIATFLMPAILAQLNEAKSVALLQAFEKNLDQGRTKKLLKQVTTAGKQIVQMWLSERLSRSTDRTRIE